MKKTITAMLILIILTTFTFTAQTNDTEQAQQQRDKFIEKCRSYLGTPYLYGGTTSKGMDCSGFIYTAAKESLGLNLERRAEDLYLKSEHISYDEMQPGDLLFFKASTKINHAAVYLGNGTFIHAASDGPQTGVIISSIDENYWKKTYTASGRFLPVVKNASIAKSSTSSNKNEQSMHIQSQTDTSMQGEILGEETISLGRKEKKQTVVKEAKKELPQTEETESEDFLDPQEKKAGKLSIKSGKNKSTASNNQTEKTPSSISTQTKDKKQPVLTAQPQKKEQSTSSVTKKNRDNLSITYSSGTSEDDTDFLGEERISFGKNDPQPTVKEVSVQTEKKEIAQVAEPKPSALVKEETLQLSKPVQKEKSTSPVKTVQPAVSTIPETTKKAEIPVETKKEAVKEPILKEQLNPISAGNFDVTITVEGFIN